MKFNLSYSCAFLLSLSTLLALSHATPLPTNVTLTSLYNKNGSAFCAPGTDCSSIGMMLCTPGTYNNKNYGSCKNCTAGHYQPAFGARKCVSCSNMTMTYCPNEGMSMPYICNGIVKSHATKCSACPPGYNGNGVKCIKYQSSTPMIIAIVLSIVAGIIGIVCIVYVYKKRPAELKMIEVE